MGGGIGYITISDALRTGSRHYTTGLFSQHMSIPETPNQHYINVYSVHFNTSKALTT